MSIELRNKAQEAAKGGPLGNACNTVAELYGNNPEGSCLLAHITALHLLARGPALTPSARLALWASRHERDRRFSVSRP